MLRILLFILASSALAQEPSVTSQNLQGQKQLFEKGWFIISSPVEAWDYAVQNNEASKEAYAKAISRIKPSKETFAQRAKIANETKNEIQSQGKKFSEAMMKEGADIQRASFAMSSEKFKKSWQALSLGYVGFGEASSDDLEALKKINIEFFKRTKEDFKTIDEGMRPVLGYLLEKSDVSWKKYFKEAKHSFTQQYEKSGTRKNSLAGLWDILVGYASWSYKAVFIPTAKTTYQETKRIPYYSSELVLKTFIATSNVIHSLGANLYYTSKLGYRVIAPSLEAGYLSSLAMLGVLNGAVTSNLVRSVGLVNKVAIAGAAPVVAGSQLVIEDVSTRAGNAATYIIHGSEAVAEVVLEKVETGVVLGYSALSQIPAQLLLTSINSAIFLVYDGPRLILVKATGYIGDKNVEDIPVGSVLHMQRLQNQGVKIETLSDDPEIIKKVLEHAE